MERTNSTGPGFKKIDDYPVRPERNRPSGRSVVAVKVCLLGSLEVLDDDGKVLELPGSLLRTLFAALALRCGEAIGDDQLVDTLWGEETPSRPANALQRQVSTLRRALGSTERVQRRGTGYALVLERTAVDIFRFDDMLARGHDAMRAGEVEMGRELLDEALALWRGEALTDFAYDEFARQSITRLREARVVATELRIDADLALGRDSALISELEQLVLEHPLREHLWAQLMLALSRSGRQAESLRAYQSARTVLGEELGIEPSAELRALEHAILQQDDSVVRHPVTATSAARRSNLRTPLTMMIGRQHDVERLRAVVRAHRLVTLVGPGGVGKSRLAIDAALEWFASEEGDAWFVELADVADSDGVVPAIVKAVDLAAASDDTRTDARRLTDYLQSRSALVVLDNCEHLIAAVARIAQELLESCPNLRIWTTSREGLAIPAEVLWSVPPLQLDDAIALFIERGRAADTTSHFDDDPARRDLVQSICARLDGLPLAIELAAARLRAMPIAELAAGIEDRFRLLNRGARTALPRQQTLRAVVDWSYDLLFDDERIVFARLSVFRGSCTLAAAKAVCSDADINPDDVVELVSRLADKSLLVIESDEIEGYSRCHMLQTLVDYGHERLEISGDAARVYEAHVRYFADFAVRSLAALRGLKQRAWLRAVTRNLPNLRAAFDVALSEGDAESAHLIAGCLGWYWWFTGRAIEGSRWMTLTRTCDGEVDPVSRARVFAWSAFMLSPGFVRWSEREGPARSIDGAPTSALVDEIDALSLDACETLRAAGATVELAGVEIALAVSYSTLGEHSRALHLLSDAASRLSDVEPQPHVTAMRAYATARRAFIEDQLEIADAEFRESIELLDACGADAHKAFALRYLGRVAVLRGDIPASVEIIERALAAARELGLSGFANVLLTDLGESLSANGDFERAREILEEPLIAAREAGFQRGIGHALTALAILEWRAGEHELSARLATEALDIALDADDRETGTHCLTVLGFVSAARGEIEKSRRRHVEALQLAPGPDHARRTALALEGLASVMVLADDHDSAARMLGAANALRHTLGAAAGTALAAGTTVDVAQLLASTEEALGSEASARAFTEGAADPDGTVSTAIRR
jgi:predicted ATPase/DNA-binding SARP family transcriptional activator/tetratricopeptide (TPR) repeat protein